MILLCWMGLVILLLVRMWGISMSFLVCVRCRLCLMYLIMLFGLVLMSMMLYEVLFICGSMLIVWLVMKWVFVDGIFVFEKVCCVVVRCFGLLLIDVRIVCGVLCSSYSLEILVLVLILMIDCVLVVVVRMVICEFMVVLIGVVFSLMVCVWVWVMEFGFMMDLCRKCVLVLCLFMVCFFLFVCDFF